MQVVILVQTVFSEVGRSNVLLYNVLIQQAADDYNCNGHGQGNEDQGTFEQLFFFDGASGFSHVSAWHVQYF